MVERRRAASVAHHFVSLVRELEPAALGGIPLHTPHFGALEKERMTTAIESSFVSSVSPEVTEFESRICEFTGSRFAVATTNGTTALQLALLVAGIRPDNEVLVPSLTFVATANAVIHARGIPHFIDSESKSGQIDVQKLDEYLESIVDFDSDDRPVNRQTGRRIHSIIPMHTFGYTAPMHELLDLCAKYRIVAVEDAAESLGSFLDGQHTGTLGTLGILSFNGNKIITTGGGGMILTNDESLAAHARHLSTTAKVPHPWRFVHDEVGFNFRLPGLNAALGCAQIERLPNYLDRKRQLFRHYREGVAGLDDTALLGISEESSANHWLCTVSFTGELENQRDEILEEMIKNDIHVRAPWTLMSDLEIFKSHPRMNMEGAQRAQASMLNLPSSPWLIGGDILD